jgi:hypothetical protein
LADVGINNAIYVSVAITDAGSTNGKLESQPHKHRAPQPLPGEQPEAVALPMRYESSDARNPPVPTSPPVEDKPPLPSVGMNYSTLLYLVIDR